MASQDGTAARQVPSAVTDQAQPRTIDWHVRVTAPVSAATLIAAAVGVALDLPGKSPGVIAAAAVALVVAAAGVAFVFVSRSESLVPDTVALLAVGLAGATLAAIVSNSFVIAYLALAALGMRMPWRTAVVPALVVFIAMNAALVPINGINAASLAGLNIGAVFLFAIGAITRSSRIAQEQAREAQARAEDLLAQLRASQAAQAEAAALTERARLAREIHDILAHALSGLVLALDTMELLGRQSGTDPVALDQMLVQVARGQRIARDGLANTKRAIAALRGDELPGPALLDQLVDDVASTTGVRADLSVSGEQRPLSPEVGLALYRTAQEALTNSAKYAGAGASVEVRLTYEQDAVDLEVADFGAERASTAAAGLTFGGYGLTGMRERAELLGGNLTAGPTDRGFAVRLRLPAPATSAPTGPAIGSPR